MVGARLRVGKPRGGRKSLAIRVACGFFSTESGKHRALCYGSMRSALLSLALLVPALAVGAPNPCDGIERGTQGEGREALGNLLARQLGVTEVQIIQSYRSDIWHVLAVESDGERTYLVYAGDPLRTGFVASWAGAGTGEDENSVRSWVIRSATKIPQKLAGCFAWSVTRGSGL